jgi:hypothetical protein
MVAGYLYAGAPIKWYARIDSWFSRALGLGQCISNSLLIGDGKTHCRYCPTCRHIIIPGTRLKLPHRDP